MIRTAVSRLLPRRNTTFSLSCRSLASHSDGRATVNLLGNSYPRDSHTNVTPAIISKLSAQLHNKPAHPIFIIRKLIESHFPSYGHLASLSPVVSPHKNFDELSFSADHPGRATTDSYYINKDTMLRTHTSTHEVEIFKEGYEKWLLTADVYRRDEIDASHYPVFHQMEGACLFDVGRKGIEEIEADNARIANALAQENIEIEDNTRIHEANPFQSTHDPLQAQLVTTNLKHNLNSLLLKIFTSCTNTSPKYPLKVRWIEAYFPFTSPSYEVEVFFNGKWLELLGCGVVQQSTLDRAGVHNKIGWAFGLGLERIAMVLFSIPDIRLFWSQDPRFLSQFSNGNVTAFQPYSKFPPCYKDVSFWLPQSAFHENDICDLVRDEAGDLVETVQKIDSFTHPKTKRSSVCYRINYRSMDSSLSNEQVNEIHERVRSRLAEQFGVEIR